MKSRRPLRKFLSILLTAAMVLSLLPTVAYAENQELIKFKNMTMNILRNRDFVSTYAYQEKDNTFIKRFNFNQDDTWVDLGFVISYSQRVSLELFRLDESIINKVPDEDGFTHATLASRIELDKPDFGANDPEDFLVNKESLGYLNGVRFTGNIDGGEGDDFVYYKDVYENDAKAYAIADAVRRSPERTTMHDEYVYGFEGESYAHWKAAQGANAYLIEPSSVPVEEEIPVIPPEKLPVEPVVPPEEEAPVEPVTPPEEDATEPTEPTTPAEDSTTSEADSISETLLHNEPADTPNENGESSVGPTTPPTEETSDPGSTTPPVEETPAEPETPPVEEVPAEPEAPQEEQPVPPEETPALSSGLAREESVLVGSPQNGPMLMSGMESFEGMIQNMFFWDGQVDNGGVVSQFDFTPGYYVIVMTPTNLETKVYNSFLAFEVTDETSPEDTFQDLASYEEVLAKMKPLYETEDPVNLLTGSFSWEYTDFAMYGKQDLSFNRYYESKDAANNHGLGYGWSTDYSCNLKIYDLYAQLFLPKGNRITFEQDFDGTYRDSGDYTLTKTGDGYAVHVKSGTIWNFDSAGKLTSVVKLDGSTTNCTYSGDKLTGISNDTGSFTLSYSGDNVSSVTDSTGRSIRFAYDGDYLSSMENPDSDSLRYTYDNGFLSRVENFEGEVYVENTYDDMGRVIHQYAINIGTFDFTYDFDARHNVCTGTDGYLKEIWYDAFGRITASKDAAGTREMEYNDLFQIISETDREGNTTRYTYDEDGNKSRITYADGTSESYSYDENRMVTSLVDREGNASSYTYDSQGHMLTSTDALGNTTSYAYDAKGNMTASTTPLNEQTQYTYDAKGNCTSMTDVLGNVTAFVYDDQGRMVSSKDAMGHETFYEYTTAGKLVKTTDAAGSIQTNEVNGNGFNTATSDWMGNITRYTYDEQSNVTSITDPMGFVTTYTYDDRGNQVTATDERGFTTNYAYDAAGRLTTSTDALGHSSTYTYDANSNITSSTDAEGAVTRYVYDNMNRVTSVTDGRGAVTQYAYDDLDRQTTETDPLNFKATKTYDKVGNLIAETDKNGNTWAYAYDADNRLISSKDPLGNVTTYVYDALGQMTSTTTPMGSTSSFVYDAIGNQTSATDPLAHTTTYTYDELGRVTGVTNKDGTETASEYNANGALVKAVDEEGYEISFAYDNNGRQTEVKNARGFATSYTYDEAGNVTVVTDALNGTTSSVYDAVGNLTSVTDAEGYTTRYTYDKVGRVTTTTDAVGAVTRVSYDQNGNIIRLTQADGYDISYTYNARNELSSYVDAAGYTHKFTYDGNGNTVSTTDGNGNTTVFTYDALNRAIGAKNAENGISGMTYDADGRRTSVTDEEGGVTSYTYDKDGRITAITDALGHVTGFTYDAMDRVLTITDARGGVTAYTYTKRGEVATKTDAEGYVISYEYDGNGNCVKMTTVDGDTVSTYDELDRLVKIVTPDGESETFTYDKVGNITTSTDKNGNTTKYVYDGVGQVTETIDALGNSALFTYDSMGNLVKTELHRVDTQDKVDEWETTLYEFDGRGLVTKEVNALGDMITYAYDGNGNLKSKTDADGYKTEYTYNCLDLATSINYNGAKNVQYRYNKTGDLVYMKDWLGESSFEVDLLHQLTAATDHKGNRVEYTYDAVGNQTEIAYPDGTAAAYAYDLVHNQTDVTETDGSNTTYTYDGMGRVTELRYPNGWVEYYTYDAMGRILKVNDTHPSEKPAKTQKHTYEYDANGNLTYEYMRGNGTGQAKNETLYTYDALNRVVTAHDNYGNSTRTYTYDSLGNLTLETGNGSHNTDYRYNNLNQQVDRSDDGWKTHTVSAYDHRGNLVLEQYGKNKKLETSGAYTFDETNRMVEGVNGQAEKSIYAYNGLGALMANTWIIAKNGYGYHDVDADEAASPASAVALETPEFPAAEETAEEVSAATEDNALTEPLSDTLTLFANNGNNNGKGNGNKDKPSGSDVKKTSTVVKQFVVDFSRPDFKALQEHEVNGLDYRYVNSDKARLSVVVQGIDTGSASLLDANGELHAYYHTDYLGTTDYLTSAVNSKVISWTNYNEWGEITHNAVLKCGARELDLVKEYATHDYDSVLQMYYAKARMYDAYNRRFTAVDLVKGSVIAPMSLVQYLYVLDNPLKYIDPLGLMTSQEMTNVFNSYKANGDLSSLVKSVFNGTLRERNSLFHRLTQIIVATEIYKRGGPSVSVAFEARIASKEERGSVDVLAIKDKMYYAFEVKPKYKVGGEVLTLHGFKGEAEKQLQSYYRIFKCNGIKYANKYSDYTKILPGGIIFKKVIYKTSKDSLELIIENNSERLPGYVTYQTKYTHADEKKNKEQLPNIQFSYMYEGYQNTYLNAYNSVDEAFYKVAGKRMDQLTNAQLVGYGFVGGGIVVVGSAAAAWIALTALPTGVATAPLTFETASGPFTIQVAATQEAARAAAAATGAKIIDFAATAAALRPAA